MANRCRDCNTCTNPARAIISFAAGFVHLSTVGISYVVKRTRRHCPTCKHLLTSHRYSTTGAFQD